MRTHPTTRPSPPAQLLPRREKGERERGRDSYYWAGTRRKWTQSRILGLSPRRPPDALPVPSNRVLSALNLYSRGPFRFSLCRRIARPAHIIAPPAAQPCNL